MIYDMIYDMIYLTAIGLTPGGSSTHLHTKQYIEQHIIVTNNTWITIHELGRVRAVPRLCEVYPGICLTTEEKARENLSQGTG
jgi:hypothetical protein